MSRVLAFGDDRSAEADRAWGWIAAHEWPGWRLEIVTAEAPADMRPVESEEAELHPWDPDDPRSTDVLGFDSAEHLRAEVDPRLALISRSWDLVVIGPRGSGMLKSLHLGSTADWLLREPVSPLLIARQPGPVRRILVATDGSAHAKRAIVTLGTFPWLDGVEIQVMSVSERRVEAESAVSDAADALMGTDADIETKILGGRPTHAIAQQVEAFDADLIVMGARGHGGIRRVVVGSTTSAITGSVDRSILVAHASEDQL